MGVSKHVWVKLFWLLLLCRHNLRKPWLTQYVTGFSPQSARIRSRVLHIRFVVGVDTGIDFLQSISVFAFHCHSTNAPYSKFVHLLFVLFNCNS